MSFSELTSRVTHRVGLLSFSGDGATGALRDRWSVLALLLLLGIPSLSCAIELESDTQVATAGYYQLTWHNADENVSFEIQEADNAEFYQAESLYQGWDRATVVTGRSDGTYYYRARLVDVNGTTGVWSDTVKVRVEHHPLSRALGFFTVGAVVFLAILIAILLGNRRYHNKESQ